MTKSTMSNAIESALREVLQTVNTAIPGHVIKFDPSTQQAEIQIGIKKVTKKGTSFNPAPIIKCPVNFSGGKTFRVEHEINPGDEGLIIFSQRCIEAWRDQGGIAANDKLRLHDMTDAFFIPGVRSQANKLSNFQNNGVRLTDGDNYIWLKNDTTADINVSTLNITGDIVHNGSTTQTGDLTVSGTITGSIINAMTSLIVAGLEMLSHRHGNVSNGPNISGGPQ